MLCALNLDREDALPRNRMSLYSQAVNLLTDTRDAGRGVPSALTVPLESKEKLILLQDLAWYLQSNDTLEMPLMTARRLVSERLATMPQVHTSPDTVVRTLLERSGVLQQPVKDYVGFVHRTLQEYLAARRAADLGDMGLLIGKAHLQQWRETVLMAAGCAIEPMRESLITGIAARARAERDQSTRLRRLIVSCWEALPSISAGIRAVIDECVASLIPPNDFGEARALATAGKDVLSRLPPVLDRLSEGQAACCVRTVWLVNGPEALDLLRRYAADQRPAVEMEISRAWDYFDSGEYAARVLSGRPPGGGLYLTDSETQLAALGTVSPLSRLQVTLPSPADFRFLTRHAESLRTLLIHIRDAGTGLSGLPRLPQLAELSIGAPGLAELSFLNSLPQLRRIWLTTCDNIDDYSSLARFTELSALSLVGCGRLRDPGQLPPLSDVRSLSLVGAGLEPGALHALAKAAPGLAHLALKDCGWVSGLEGLSTLRLEDLRLPGNSSITDLTPLASQTCLRALDVRYTGVRDLTPLSGLPHLRRLWIAGISAGTDVSPLARNRDVHIYIDERQRIRGSETIGDRLHIQALPRNRG
jgi:Leucine-rich repeat (LRR) protein